MNRKHVIMTVLVISLVGLVAAQAEQADVGPGIIGPDSGLYGLEIAWDNAAMSIGLKQAGTVAQERAAEAEAMMQKETPDPAAAARAAQELGKVAERAGPDDADGLQRAMSKLQDVMQNAPTEQAAEGMQAALENMEQAQNRMQDALQRAEDARQGTDNTPDGQETAPTDGGSTAPTSGQ